MPQVTYTAAKGLVQSAGSGLSIQGNMDLAGVGTLSGELKSVPAALAVASTTLTAADSGKVYLLTPANAASTRSVTLPTAAAGLHFRFILKSASNNAAGHFTVVQAGATQDFVGTVLDGAGTSDSATASDTLVKFVGVTAVGGDSVEVVSDGTLWYIRGACKTAGGIVFA